MQFDLRTVTLAPSGLTYGVLGVAVTVSSGAAWLLGRRLSPAGVKGHRELAVRAVGLIVAAAVTLFVAEAAYLLIISIIVPGACTYLARPTWISLAVPLLVLAAGAASRFSWFPRARVPMATAVTVLVWLGTIEAAYTIAFDDAYLEASRRHGVTSRQSIDHERARVVLPDAAQAIHAPFNAAALRLPSGASRDEVRSALGEPSDEGSDAAVVAALVGIPVDKLDVAAFRYMRYLYSDGSYTVFVVDACSDRVLSQVMMEASRPSLLDRVIP
jgi:hypothetical protein